MTDEVITQQQSDMVTMLIAGENITDIAKRLKVNRNTVYNWMKKDHIKAEMDKRKQELTHQGNHMILKDIATYISNIKDLANDKSDKRVALAANQYLLNRVFGNPTSNVDLNPNKDDGDIQDTNELADEISNFKRRKAQ